MAFALYPSLASLARLPVTPVLRCPRVYAGGCATPATAVPTTYMYSSMPKNADGSYVCSAATSCPSTTSKSPTAGYVATCPTPPGALVTTGFAVGTEYSGVPCSVTTATVGYSEATYVNKLGYCASASNGAGTMLLVNAYGPTSGTPSGYVMSTFYNNSVNCAGTTSSSTYYAIGKCPSTWTSSNGNFLVYSVAATVPAPPTGDLAVYNYANAATCAATDSSQIIGAAFYSYPPQFTQTATCYNSYSNDSSSGAYAFIRNYCGPQAFVASSAPSGGFIIIRQYSVRYTLIVFSSHHGRSRLVSLPCVVFFILRTLPARRRRSIAPFIKSVCASRQASTRRCGPPWSPPLAVPQ